MTSDGIEGARPIGTWLDETHHSDGTEERRVAFIGHPATGKSTLAGCCGERCDGTEEDLVFEGELPGFVGMIHTGRSDLARRAKDIACRGRVPIEEVPVEDVPRKRPIERPCRTSYIGRLYRAPSIGRFYIGRYRERCIEAPLYREYYAVRSTTQYYAVRSTTQYADYAVLRSTTQYAVDREQCSKDVHTQ